VQSQVEVGCTAVRGSAGRAPAKADHCAIRVTYASGYSFVGELLPVNGLNEINTYSSREQRALDFEWNIVKTPAGSTAELFVFRVVTAFVEQAAVYGGKKYHFDGARNSNSFINNVIVQAGGHVPEFAVRPGRRPAGICGGAGARPGLRCR